MSEEAGSPTVRAVLEHLGPEVRADVIIAADSENFSEQVPALAYSVRGQINFVVTVSTLAHAQHAGTAGGAYPDAMIPMSRLLASFHSADGSVAVDGLASGENPEQELDEATVREDIGVLAGVEPLAGGALAAWLWRRPSVTVTGLTMPDPVDAPTVLSPRVSAKVTVRVSPNQPVDEAWRMLEAHISRHTAFNAHVELTDVSSVQGTITDLDSDAARVMLTALTDGWGETAVAIGAGGSSGVCSALADRFPGAPMLMTGVIDPRSRPHAADESVSLDALEKSIAAEALFLIRMNDSDSRLA